MSWSDQPTGEQKTLRAIGDKLNAPPTDSTENLIYLNKSVKFISGMVEVLQNGVDDANADILLQVQNAVEDLLVIFGLSSSGDTLNFEWGELAMLLKNFSSIFSLQRIASGDWAQLPFNVQLGWIKDIWDNIFGKLSLQSLLGVGSDNMIAIGRFDVRSQVPSVPGWTFDNTTGHETNGCAKVTANGTFLYLPLNYIATKPGDSFPVSGWFNTTGATGTGAVQLIGQAYTEEGVKVGADVVIDSENVTGTMGWTQISGTYVVPATAKSVRFGPRVTDGVLGGVIRCDDYTTIKPKSFLDISWIIGLIQSAFDMSWLSELSISQLGPAGSVNLLEGTFDAESSIDLSNAEGWSHNATVGRTKPGSAETTGNGIKRELRTKAFKASPGTKLDLEAYAKWAGVTASSGTAFTVALIAQLNGADVSITQIGSVTSPAASGGWSKMSGLTYTVPSGVDYVRVQITVEASVTAGTINFDDVSLTRQGSMPQDWITGLIPDIAGIRTRATETIDNIMNGLGFFGTGFSPGSLLGAIQNVPVGNIFGLSSVLGDLLPKADWTQMLSAFTAAGNSGTTPSTGVPAVDNMITSFLGVRTNAATAQSTATAVQGDLGSVVEGIFNGWFGGGSTGSVAEAQQTVEAIKDAVMNGYTVQTVTSSTTWNRPANLSEIVVIGIGSGENGQTGVVGGSPVNGASGGLGGGFLAQKFEPAGIPSSVSITIGTGGATTKFGTLLETVPGNGGIGGDFGFSMTASLPGKGGAGGIGANSSYPVESGQSTPLAVGGSPGTTPSNGAGTNGSPGGAVSTSVPTKCGGAGGGGGGGGGANWPLTYASGVGGSGGYPGGGGGGGGSGSSNTNTPGAGGLGATGVMWIFTKTGA